jgi:2-polyprenyl-6-methoxyphenol hydroxylase-like FAD-dependent oxidoreductase
MYVEAHLSSTFTALTWSTLGSAGVVEIVDGQSASRPSSNTETGQREEIACDYLAGCDGPQSMVRRHLGIAYRGDRPEEQSYGSGATVATHLRAPDLYRILKHKRCWQYRTVNPKVRSNLVTLDGEGEFTINTKLRNPEDNPDPSLVAKLILESVGETSISRSWSTGHGPPVMRSL